MENFKNWLEILYFISGPTIAVIAFLALSQIRVAKEQIEEQRKALKITSKRDALKLTSEQVAFYGDKVIPLINVLDKKIESEGIDILDKFEVNVEPGKIEIDPPDEDFSIEVIKPILKEVVDVANALESFSTYFASGLADEKIAYFSLGSTFCNTMKKLSPILVPISVDERSFTATFRLYSIWGARRDREMLEKKKSELEKKLKSKKNISVNVVGDDA